MHTIFEYRAVQVFSICRTCSALQLFLIMIYPLVGKVEQLEQHWGTWRLKGPCLEVYQRFVLSLPKARYGTTKGTIIFLLVSSVVLKIYLWFPDRKLGRVSVPKKSHEGLGMPWLGVEGEMAAKEARACRTPEQGIIWNDQVLHTDVCLFHNLELSVFTHSCLLFHTLLWHTERSYLFHTQLLHTYHLSQTWPPSPQRHGRPWCQCGQRRPWWSRPRCPRQASWPRPAEDGSCDTWDDCSAATTPEDPTILYSFFNPIWTTKITEPKKGVKDCGRQKC